MTEQAEANTENFEVVTSEVPEAEPQPAAEPEAKASEVTEGDREQEKQGEQPTGELSSEEPAANTADDASAERQAKPSRAERRIKKLTKQRGEAERRAEEAERKLAELQGKQEQSNTKPTSAEPDPSDFDSYDEYLDALGAWEGSEGEGKPEAKPAKDAQANQGANDDEQSEPDPEFAEAHEEVMAQFDESREKYSDFDQVIGADDLAITQDMVIAMSEADNAGDIAYYLGTHKQEATKIASMTPRQQAREIAKLEVKVASVPKSAKRTTKAPQPIEPVGGSDGSAKDPRDMSFAEYEASQNQREQKRGSFW